MDELLAQQLDRHKKQKPSTSSGAPATAAALTAQQARPSTTGISQPTRQAGQLAAAIQSSSTAAAPSRGRLASWLNRDEQQQQQQRTRAPSPEPDEANSRPFRGGQGYAATMAMSEGEKLVPTAEAELDALLEEGKLQEMSKQRLVQLILQQIVPSLRDLRESRKKHSEAEFGRLQEELRAEQNRFELAELRHEQRLKLAEQKWAQLNRQLETRLEASEHELGQLMASQREHLEQLADQYQGDLRRLGENYEQRLRAEQARFDDQLRRHDELHRLELESKLNVNLDLSKLNTVQAEWRRALELTIGQLNDQFRSIESLLDKQAQQVNGTNSELAKRTGQLCEQYDKYDELAKRLAQLSGQLNELMPTFVSQQREGQCVLRAACDKLSEFSEASANLERRKQALDGLEMELNRRREELSGEGMQLKLDLNRLEFKEKRLDELIKSNKELEEGLNKQSQRQLEEEAHLRTKRVHLEAKADELREQNHGLHLLRRRLGLQKEEVIKAQLGLEEGRAKLKSQLERLEAESGELRALRVRAGCELDQLKRLQSSLVCSLCMGSLFDGGGGDGSAGGANNQSIERANGQLARLATAADSNLPARGADLNCGAGSLGRLIASKSAPGLADRPATGSEAMALRRQREQIERDTSELLAESKYVELLAGTN